MKMQMIPVWFAAAFVVMLPAIGASNAVEIDTDDIGGVVRSAAGPEAGVWVIAEASGLPTPYVKIVVTDDAGCYVLPDLPAGDYSVWVRGYGLVDSNPVTAVPAAELNLNAIVAPDAAAAAEIYPANYWFALFEPPRADAFPGTGPNGNGIPPGFKTQVDWVIQVKESCLPCHQLGTKVTCEMPNIGNSVEAWDQRVQKERPADNVVMGKKSHEMTILMSNAMTRYGRQRALQMFVNWTDRIAAGALPSEAPPRPKGVERNVVIMLWDWADGHFIHDAISTDRRNPTFNAGGLIYGLDEF